MSSIHESKPWLERYADYVPQRWVIGVLDVESTDELDQIIMAGLPMAEYLTFEQVLPVREYAAFAEDIRRRWE